MSNYPSTYGCRYLPPEEACQVLEALPTTLQNLLDDVILIVWYGWDSNLHPELQGLPMHVGLSWLSKFIADSIRQDIVRPGRSDFGFEVPDKRLEIVFCHEGDIHIGGQDSALVENFVKSEPFAGLLVDRQTD